MNEIMPEQIEFISKVRDNGNSLIVTIPKRTCTYCRIKSGQEVRFKIILNNKNKK